MKTEMKERKIDVGIHCSFFFIKIKKKKKKKKKESSYCCDSYC